MCKIEWEILDIFKKDSRNSECYKDVYIKIKTDESVFDSFLVAKWTYKHNTSNNCAFKTVFTNESDLPKIWDKVSYYSSFFGYEIWYVAGEDYNYICPKSPFLNYYEFYDKCNLTWKIKDIHRKELQWVLWTHLKIDTWYWYYNVKTIESFYYGRDWYWYLGTEYMFPKLLKFGWVRFFKKGDNVSYIVDKDSWEILREWRDESLETCNVSNQKLWDFKFEWWLTPMQVVNLNMKKYREYKWIEEPKTQEQKQENNEFIVWFKFIDYSWWFMISLVMLLLFFAAVLKNNLKNFNVKLS